MPLIPTWQSHVSYNAYSMVDLKVKTKIYPCITEYCVDKLYRSIVQNISTAISSANIYVNK